jgi:hypothetical protein
VLNHSGHSKSAIGNLGDNIETVLAQGLNYVHTNQ